MRGRANQYSVTLEQTGFIDKGRLNTGMEPCFRFNLFSSEVNSGCLTWCTPNSNEGALFRKPEYASLTEEEVQSAFDTLGIPLSSSYQDRRTELFRRVFLCMIADDRNMQQQRKRQDDFELALYSFECLRDGVRVNDLPTTKGRDLIPDLQPRRPFQGVPIRCDYDVSSSFGILITNFPSLIFAVGLSMRE